MEISFPYAAAKKGSTLGPIEVLCMLLHPNLNFQVKDAVWEVIIWHVIQCTVEEEGGRAGSGSGGGSGGGGGGGDISANMVSHVAMELKFILRDFLIKKFKWNSCSGKYFPWNFSHISHIFSENIIRN